MNPEGPTGTPFDEIHTGVDGLDETAPTDEGPAPPVDRPPLEAEEPRSPTSRWGRMRTFVVGPPKDPRDKEVFHQLSLVAFLAWVGLGTDGLSSSAYGPEEAFKALLGDPARPTEDYIFLAVFLAAVTAITVFIISYTYSRIIEQFPFGGGGYVVATKLLGAKAGVVSGCALIVDYALTIATSVASGADALWSSLPSQFHVPFVHRPLDMAELKVPFEVLIIVLLVLINLRGVKESVKALVPIFMVFVVTHVFFILGGIIVNAGRLPVVLGTDVTTGISKAIAAPGMGIVGLLLLFARAYSLGGGTYTGIEAVSNGIGVMREPRVQTAKRTMVYMACSLAFTAAGIILVYLLVGARPVAGKTMNAVMVEKVASELHLGHAGAWLVVVTLISETVLLFVAAQAGLIAGPRVMANMALDSWFPHRFASLSDRLTTANGVILMGGAAAVALVWVRGSVSALVIMYSINVFVTFSLANMGMCLFWIRSRGEGPQWRRALPMHVIGLLLCLTILIVTTVEKFLDGGWLTLVVTSVVIVACLMIKRHYDTVAEKLKMLNQDLASEKIIPDIIPTPLPLLANKPTAVVLVSNFSGVGIHTCLNIFKYFPGYFSNLVFASAAVVDTGNFKGARHVSLLAAKTEDMLKKYVAFASSQGVPATYTYSIGTEPVDEAERLCKEASKHHSKCMFFAGQLIFEDEKWYHRLLHNNTAYAIQKRLQWDGLPMIILPVRVRGA